MKVFTVSMIFVLQLCAIPSMYANPLESMIDESNELPNGNNYAKVSLSYIYDGAKRGVRIIVEADETILLPCANFGIQKFGFNTTIIDPKKNLIVISPPSWSVQFGGFTYSEFGRFQVNTKGLGNDRVNPCIIDIYHIANDLSFTDVAVENNDGYLFSVHIADYTLNLNDANCKSAYFGSQKTPTSTTTTSVPATTTVPVTTTLPVTTTTTVPVTTTLPVTTTTTVPVTTTLPVTTTTTVPVTTTLPVTTTTTVPVTTTLPVTTTTTVPVTTTLPVTTTTTVPVTTTLPVTTTTTAPVTTTLPVTTTTTVPVTTTLPVTTTTTVPVTTTLPVTTTTTVPVTTTLPVTTTTTVPVTTTLPVTTTTTAPVTTTVPVTTTTTVPVTTTLPVTTTTTVPVEAEVILTPGTVFYQPTEEGGETVKQPVCLDNPDDLVGGLQFDLCEYNVADEPVDCMECIACELTERTTMFDCVVLEQPNGCCRVLLFCMNPGCAINPGVCDIVTVVYKTFPLSSECPGTDCINHIPENIVVSDYLGFTLTAEGSPGEVCPFVCGDVCPPDDPLIDGWDCGDGVVDIYDVMCMNNFALTVTMPDDCQLERADVPTGTPPNCSDPDGVIDILDVLVVIDMSLQRSDCCSFYYSGIIY